MDEKKKDNLMISSDTLEKLMPDMKKAVSLIRDAIYDKRKIVIKHHNDCDGYCGGLALENAILPLIKKNHSNSRAEFTYYKRIPSMSPYYDYSDALKELSFYLSDIKSGKLPPLIIMVDLGDIKQSMPAIQKMKTYGMQQISIDHHSLRDGEDGSCFDAFVNPHLVGGESNIVAGMLCAEISRFIDPSVKNALFLAALAGTGDKSSNEEYDQYCDASGCDTKFLKKCAIALDYEAHHLRYSESRAYVRDLCDPNCPIHQELIQQAFDNAMEHEELIRPSIRHFIVSETFGDITFSKVDCENVSRRGKYPSASSIVRIAHDSIEGNKVTIGILPDCFIFRIDGILSLDVNEIILNLKSAFPYASVEGGGHKFAGSIRFVPGVKADVLAHIERYIRKWIVR